MRHIPPSTKYSPNLNRVDYVIKVSGMTTYDFERFYGIPNGTIADFRGGRARLPKVYWNIFNKPAKVIADKIEAIRLHNAKHGKRVPHILEDGSVDTTPKTRRSRLPKEETKSVKTSVKKIGVLANLLN